MNRVLLPVMFLVIAAGTARGADDPLDPPSIGGIIAQNLQDAASAYGEAQQHRAALAQQIQQARAQYWQAYGGPDFEEAAAAFRRVLLAKDMIYLTIYVSQGIPRGEGGKMARLLERAVSVDGGIPYAAVPAFTDLVTALRKDLGARGDEDQVFIAALGPALAKRQDRFVAYIRARDWHEVQTSGADLSKILTPQAYLLGLLEAGIAEDEYPNPDQARPDPRDEARALYARIVKAVGEEPVVKAARAVLAAPKTADGGVTPPGRARSIAPYLWFEELLAADSPKGYALIVLRGPQLGGDAFASRWNGGFAVYDRLVKEHGEARVAAVAASVQKAPKYFEVETLVADFSTPEMHNEGWWINALLADAKPRGLLSMVGAGGKRLRLPTVTRMIVLDATDVDAVLKHAPTGVPIKVRAQLGEHRMDPPNEVPRYFWISLRGVDPKRLMFRCRAEYQPMFKAQFPVGSYVEVTGTVGAQWNHPTDGIQPGTLTVDFLAGKANIARYDPAGTVPAPAAAVGAAGGEPPPSRSAAPPPAKPPPPSPAK